MIISTSPPSSSAAAPLSASRSQSQSPSQSQSQCPSKSRSSSLSPSQSLSQCQSQSQSRSSGSSPLTPSTSCMSSSVSPSQSISSSPLVSPCASTASASSAASFRCLPQGLYTLVPTLFTTMAWIASMFQDGCDYARVMGPIVTELTRVDGGAIPFLEVGFSAYREPVYNGREDQWTIEYSGACLQYDNDLVPFDPAWTAAKGFAFLALVLGGGGSLFLWFSTCCVFSRGTWRWAGYEVLLAAMFQLLSFSWFATALCNKTHHLNRVYDTANAATGNNDDDTINTNHCGLGWGSKANFVSVIFWFLAAFLIFIKYPTPKPLLPPRQFMQQMDHPMDDTNTFKTKKQRRRLKNKASPQARNSERNHSSHYNKTNTSTNKLTGVEIV